MAGVKELQARIVLSGSVDNTFTNLGSKISTLGSQISGIGMQISLLTAPLVAYGKSVFDVYKDYDTAIRTIQAVGEYTNDEMQLVIAAAREYGAETRFSSADAANAMITVTQAGYGLNEMIDAMPAIFQAAVIGEQDLATTAEQIVKSMTAAGIASEDAGAYVDALAAVASASTTDVAGLTESMVFLGSIPRGFEGGYKEALKWLGVLGDLGYEGTTAGMHLRNMYLSLAAPTGGAAEAIQDIADQTGESIEDIQAAYDEFEASGAGDSIREMGLQIFDSEGKFRSFEEIFNDFNKATATWTDEKKAGAFKKIFARRTFAAATAAMEAVGDSAGKMDSALDNSHGRAQQMVDIMEGGVAGAAYEVESAWEELQLAFGDALNETAIEALEKLHEVLISISETDPAVLKAWADAAISITGIGAGLMVGGKTLSLFGKLMGAMATPAGGIVLGGAALAALMFAVDNAEKEMTQADIESHMGDIELNALAMSEALTGMGSGLGTQVEELNGYATELERITTSYSSIAKTLSGNMLEAVALDIQLTETDISNLKGFGESLVANVEAGIQQAQIMSSEFVGLLFGDGEGGVTALADVSTYYGGLRESAKTIGQELRDQITAALQDKNLDDAERSAITATVGRLNEIMSQIQTMSNRVEQEKLLSRGQRLGREGLDSSIGAMAESRDQYNEIVYDNLDTLVAMYEVMYERGDIGRGEADAKIGEARSAAQARLAENAEGYNKSIARLINAVLGDAYKSEFDFAESKLKEGFEQKPFILKDPQRKQGPVAYLTALESWLWKAGIQKETGLAELMKNLEAAYPVRDLTDTLLKYKAEGTEAPAELVELYQTYFNARLMGALSEQGQAGLLDESGVLLWDILTDPAAAEGADASSTFSESFAGTLALDGSEKFSELEAAAGVSGSRSGANYTNGFNSALGLKTPSPGGNGGPGALLMKYSEGGLASQPSIFGEAGPEWAIPQEHSDRTLALLDSARKASGFSWDEIGKRTGGLNASADAGRTLIYSPTIYANDANGVEKALKDSEARMERWWDKQQTHKERLVYA